MKKKELMEKYCKINGWIKKKGILIDIEKIGDDFDNYFVADENKDDYYKKCEMWCDESGNDEGVYDDSEIIDYLEEHCSDLTFKEFKKTIA